MVHRNCHKARVVLGVIVALLLSSCSSSGHHSGKPVSKAIGDNVVASSTQLPSGLKAAVAPKVSDPLPQAYAEAFAHPISVTPSGPLKQPTQLTFPLKQKVAARDQVVVFTREDGDTDWTPLQTTLAADRQHVTVTVNHLSNFVAELVSELDARFTKMVENFTSDLGNDISHDLFARANKPACSNSDKAQQNDYHLQLSNPEDALYQCMGMDGSRRVLKVVNRLKVPLQVNYSYLTFQKFTSADLSLQNIIGNGSGALQHLLDPGAKYVILMPNAEADFTVADLAENHYAKLSTEYSGWAQSLYQLEFGVALSADIVATFSKSAAKSLVDPKSDEVLKRLNGLLDMRDCAQAVANFNGGSIVRHCFGEDGEKLLFGEAVAVLLAPVAIVASIVDFIVKTFNEVARMIDHKDRAAVAVVRQNQFLGTWKEGSSTLTINGDGTATRHWIMYMACSDPNLGPSCDRGDATLRVSISGDTATITYVSVKFSAPNGGPIVGDVGEDEPLPGDKEVLKLLDTGLLSRTFQYHSTGFPYVYTHYWCGSDVSASNLKKCKIDTLD